MTIVRLPRIAWAAALLASAALPDTTLRGPVLGYVLDGRARAVRPVNGIPGASHLGAPLDLGSPIARAVFASTGSFGLVVPEAGDGVWLVAGLDAQASLAPIAGTIRPDRLALNAANTAALLYAAAPRRLQVIRGLPGSPAAGPVLDLSSLTGALAALALDQAGAEALLALSGPDGGALARVRLPDDGDASELRAADSRLLFPFGAPSALALLNQDRDLVLTDAASNQLILIRDLLGSPAVETLASERDGVAGPVGVAVSDGGRRVFVANASGPGSVLILDLETRAVELRATPEGPPSRLAPLQGRTAFLLNEPGDVPLMLLDNLDQPGVYFVPDGREN